MKHLLPVIVLLTAACRGEPAPAPASASSITAPASASAPEHALDALDARTPVPLLPMMAHHQKENMRDHLLAVQQIVTATATRDYAAVEKAAARIGYSESMGAMCRHLGSGAPGFAAAALEFHHAADRIGEAARAKDAEAALAALGQTLRHCTSCHATYKQQIVDEASFGQLPHRD